MPESDANEPQPDSNGAVDVPIDQSCTETEMGMGSTAGEKNPGGADEGEHQGEAENVGATIVASAAGSMAVPATLADAVIAIAPPPPTYLLAQAGLADSGAGGRGRGRGRGTRGGGGPGSRGGKVRSSQARTMMLYASSSVPLPISGTAEAAALASGEIPNLRFASAELQKSLLPVSGEAPLAPAALTQAG